MFPEQIRDFAVFAGLKHLETFPALKAFALHNAAVTDDSVQEILAAQHLEEVELKGTRLSPSAIADIQRELSQRRRDRGE